MATLMCVIKKRSVKNDTNALNIFECIFGRVAVSHSSNIMATLLCTLRMNSFLFMFKLWGQIVFYIKKHYIIISCFNSMHKK